MFAPKFIRAQCRYSPCCSDYAISVISHYGITKGIFLAIFRIIRCFPPFGGYDPPPNLKDDNNGT